MPDPQTPDFVQPSLETTPGNYCLGVTPSQERDFPAGRRGSRRRRKKSEDSSSDSETDYYNESEDETTDKNYSSGPTCNLFWWRRCSGDTKAGPNSGGVASGVSLSTFALTRYWRNFISAVFGSNNKKSKPERPTNGLSSNLFIWILGGIFIWVIFQTYLIDMTMKSRKLNSRAISAMGDFPETADEISDAFAEFQKVRQLIPQKFGNFSDYLLQQKQKAKHLKSQLKDLDAKKLAILNSILVPPAPPPPKYSAPEAYEMRWTYDMDEKEWPYVGDGTYLDISFANNSRHYYNSMAVFPNANRTRKHGLVGMHPNGTRAFHFAPMPPNITDYPGGKAEALKIGGGFYLNLSDALPLDRDPVDGREEFCKAIKYNMTELDDVSVIITFYNEPLSTLMRSVHSVLNHTPPPLLREIILVDDHSNLTANEPGGELYSYLRMLPKTKLMRLPSRRGLVQARLAGARLAQAPVLVILDSHIEVNYGWLEPQLQRLNEERKSVVFPQILSVDSTNFEYINGAGIGCFLSFKWVMQERPYFTGVSASPDAVPSASMAGGLFAVRRDWFFESGGYDEEFSMWGAENVEMAFRIWMCGGRVECTPCARTYHIYRNGGHGYTSPSGALVKNRLRTSRVWMDEWYQISERFNDKSSSVEIGSLDKMLELKERLKCKPFKWFLDNVDPKRDADLEDFGMMGAIKHQQTGNICIDNIGHKSAGTTVGTYHCHGLGGSQGWFQMKKSGHVKSQMMENICWGHDMKFTDCVDTYRDDGWIFEDKKIKFHNKQTNVTDCLTLINPQKNERELKMVPCDGEDKSQIWEYTYFERDPNFQLPTLSPEYRRRAEQRTRKAIDADI